MADWVWARFNMGNGPTSSRDDWRITMTWAQFPANFTGYYVCDGRGLSG
jgi:hypothetical protein